jgi:hypothetical protein
MVTVARGPRTGVHGSARAAVFAALLLAFLVQPLDLPARADDPFYGHDISWPQCARGDGGYGLPLPPESTDFVVVGLTHGRAFTENPCLAEQVDWLREHEKPGHAYAMGTFPTPAQLRDHGHHGPFDGSTWRGRLRNTGFAAAKVAVASLESVHWRPPMVWIDVEAQPRQPWPTGTEDRRRDNRAVLEGLRRGLEDHGFDVGFYSYRAGWQAIVGDWQLPDVPVWATAGRQDASAALGRCSTPSFSRGPVFLAQWWDNRRDYNLTCDRSLFD